MKTDNIYALLEERGIDPATQRVALLRHADKRYPQMYKHIGTRSLTLYQAMQTFACEPGTLWLNFYGHTPGSGLLLDVVRVNGVIPAREAIRRGLLKGSFEKQDENWSGFYHDLVHTDLLIDLRMKMEVRWIGERTWYRQLERKKNNFQVQLRSAPYVLFTGAAHASLVMSQLRIALQDVAWQQGLGAVAGVYLITDEGTGRHYVGSASGKGGILQRWRDYARNGHGDNDELIGLLSGAPGRENEFRLTVLEAMPLEAPRRQVVEREIYWKTALGSRTFGLNRN